MSNELLRADILAAINYEPGIRRAELLNRCYVALGEIDRLRSELGKANSQTAHFEREWYLRGDEIEALTAKLGEQASVPDGFVMVPAEPTDAMKLAGNDALAQHWGAGDAYRAMLAASRLPVQPVQGMSNRSKRLDEIRAEAERFFEWPGDDRSTVTLTSCILFADHIAAPSAPAAPEVSND